MSPAAALVIEGTLTAGSLRGAFGGALVSAHVTGARRPVSGTVTSRLGQFRIVLEVGGMWG